MLSARRSKVKKKEKTDDEETIEKEPKGSFAWKVFLPSQIKTLVSSENPEDLEVTKIRLYAVLGWFRGHTIEGS